MADRFIHTGKVLIVNGWAANAAFWMHFCWVAEQVGLFSRSQVSILDLDQSLNESQWVDLIQANIRADTLVIGWSLGGIFAVQAVAQTALIKNTPKSLVLLNTAPGFHQKSWPLGMNDADFEQFYQTVSSSPEQLIKTFSFLMVKGSRALREDRKQLKNLFNTSSLPSKDILLGGLALLKTAQAELAWKNLSVPTLLISGREDALFSPASVDAGAQLNDRWIQHTSISGMGHLPTLGFADQVVSAITHFYKLSDFKTKKLDCYTKIRLLHQ